MLKLKIYNILLMAIIILNISSYVFAEDRSKFIDDCWHLINLRYSGVLGLNTNYTFQTLPFPLQVNAGLGTGGYKAGIGCGVGGNIENMDNTGELITGALGGGAKISYLKSWEDHSFSSTINKKHIGEWIGIEATLALVIGIDIGYYRSLSDNHETLSTVNIGFFY